MAIKVEEDKAKCLFFVAVISFLLILILNGRGRVERGNESNVTTFDVVIIGHDST